MRAYNVCVLSKCSGSLSVIAEDNASPQVEWTTESFQTLFLGGKEWAKDLERRDLDRLTSDMSSPNGGFSHSVLLRAGKSISQRLACSSIYSFNTILWLRKISTLMLKRKQTTFYLQDSSPTEVKPVRLRWGCQVSEQ